MALELTGENLELESESALDTIFRHRSRDSETKKRVPSEDINLAIARDLIDPAADLGAMWVKQMRFSPNG